MSKFKYYLRSARFRTLPLSLAGVITGIGLAAADYNISILTATLVCLTAVCLQLLSNVSNEYGDYLSGTDTDDRQGPVYSTGNLSDKDFRGMIAFYAILSCLSGLGMIYSSYGTFRQLEPILLIVLGGFAIIAAMRYTLGRHPYGYNAGGDLAVFIFFGLASVLGAYFVVAHEIPSALLLLPASAVGLFSVGVLNVNNIRDMKTDAATRTTVAMKLGERNARIYQTILITLGWAAMISYIFFCRMFDWWNLLCLLPLPLYVVHIVGVWKHSERELDKYLPMLVMATFLLSLCIVVSFNVYLW